MTTPQPVPGRPPAPVRAAGCVLWRRRAGKLELCLVHRPKYDDWTCPKGKAEEGEEPYDTAVREVLEETGHHCRPGVRLPTVRYTAKGHPKEVAYWEAEATGGAFAPNREVDELVWLPPDRALARLTYRHDLPLVRALLTALAGS
ncbi:DNA mismatch repair protein MutT [Streptomyces solincola]|uniref:DNA mismatch repair protein MutT n=1 Tax=Streptomyces solincola TaxID=2100817 RepID=A0A2S9PSP7_9ACTN|nr:NUDIX hydrolase [Streptomyces solincola]PRH77450.1 DNA mismatch repair protein MutT [Streptomyces solincola]